MFFRTLITIVGLLVCFNTVAAQTKPNKPRARDLGIPFDGTPAKFNRVSVLKVGPARAENILVLNPGTSASAAYFAPLARDIVRRVEGWQVWAVERRGNDLLALAAFQRSERTQADQASLERLDLPLLVVVGEQDDALASVRELAAAVPGAELVTLRGEDHQSAPAAESYKQAVARFLRARQETVTSA